jgi:hypothetical protein
MNTVEGGGSFEEWFLEVVCVHLQRGEHAQQILHEDAVHRLPLPEADSHHIKATLSSEFHTNET